MSWPEHEFGTYVHVPFCVARCDYCDFATWTDRFHLVEAYVDAVVADVRRRELPPSTSVFVGGGTPSLLSVEAMALIMQDVPGIMAWEQDYLDVASTKVQGLAFNEVGFGWYYGTWKEE